MTTPTVEQRAVPSHTRERRRDIFFFALALGLGVVLTVIIGTTINHQREYEINRADNAVAALAQACAQVERLGGHCLTGPAQIQGDTGVQGPPGPPGIDGASGRPPTEAEIAAAVATYLLANPPSAGPPGPAGPPGIGQPCPGHWELLTIKLANGGSRQSFQCVPN